MEKRGGSGKNLTLRLNKTNLIVIGICVVIVAGVLIFAFAGKSPTQEESEVGSQQGGFFSFFSKLFNFSKIDDLGEGIPTGNDTNDSADGQQTGQVCGNSCAEGYNQKPYPDCSCYLADESIDTDGDGVDDDEDAFPNDPTETQDSDGDGVGDNSDAFPNDATETTDTDGDGVGDNSDAFPNDPEQWEPYDCEDSDGEGNFDEAGWCQDTYNMMAFTDRCIENDDEYDNMAFATDWYCDEDNICQEMTSSTAGYCQDGGYFDDPGGDCYDYCKNVLGYGASKWAWDWRVGGDGLCAQSEFEDACSYVGGLDVYTSATAPSGALCCCWCCNSGSTVC